MLISTRDAKLLAKDKTPEPGEPADAKLRGGYSGAKTKPTRLLEPGDRVGSLEVVAAPGHTPGQIAFMDTRDRTLIAGDAFSTLGGVATTAKPNPLFPMPALATWHRPTALATARSLRALDPARLAVGHGKTVESARRRDGRGDREGFLAPGERQRRLGRGGFGLPRRGRGGGVVTPWQ